MEVFLSFLNAEVTRNKSHFSTYHPGTFMISLLQFMENPRRLLFSADKLKGVFKGDLIGIFIVLIELKFIFWFKILKNAFYYKVFEMTV